MIEERGNDGRYPGPSPLTLIVVGLVAALVVNIAPPPGIPRGVKIVALIYLSIGIGGVVISWWQRHVTTEERGPDGPTPFPLMVVLGWLAGASLVAVVVGGVIAMTVLMLGVIGILAAFMRWLFINAGRSR